MPIAAVPAYLGTDFKGASPGMRFGMYLKLWGVNQRTQALLWKTHDIGYEVRGQQREEREVKYENKVSALQDATGLSNRDKATMNGLVTRQSAIADTVPADHLLRLDALAIAPFTTGLGNEHPLENGFAFLNPYGLPYLPGSGIKGVLRQAARELASGDWGETHGWSGKKAFEIQVGKEHIPLSVIDALFGLESADGSKQHVRGALTFWDVIPQIKGDHLAVEIMTPHQGHYYQQKRDRKTGDSDSPHDSGQPIPISFLTVPPGSSFIFHVVCDLAFLRRIAPAPAENDSWKTLLTAAFAHAFDWCGFGAKTAVGYGAMKVDQGATVRRAKESTDREEAARQAQAAEARQTARATMTAAALAIQDFIDYMAKRHESLRGKPNRSNGEEHNRARQLSKAAQEGNDWSAEEKRAAAVAIAEWLPKVVQVDMKDERKKLKLAALKGEA